MKKRSDLKKVMEIAKVAGKILMKYYGKNYKIEIKKDDVYDLLTIADKESNDYIKKSLERQFPGDSFLLEESPDNSIDYSGRVWMVDPLDGTKNFTKKGKEFAVMMGLAINGIPEMGVVYVPVKRKMYYAEKGMGAYEESKGKKIKLKTGNRLDLKEIRLISRETYGEPNTEVRKLDKAVDGLNVKERIPSNGSVGLKLGMIASDKADAYVMTNPRGSKWDTCAPQIILEEAGGIVTDVYGKPLNYKQNSLRWESSFVASSNKKLQKKLIRALGVAKLIRRKVANPNSIGLVTPSALGIQEVTK